MTNYIIRVMESNISSYHVIADSEEEAFEKYRQGDFEDRDSELVEILGNATIDYEWED